MAVVFSEMIARRIDLALNLEAGFDNFLEAIGTGYDRFVAPLLEDGETAPDIRFHLQLMQRNVAQGRQRLESFGSPVVEQTHEDDKVRVEIELHRDAVDGKLRLVRHVCRGFYGPKGVARVGLKEEPPRSASRLHEHGVTVKKSLENPELGLKPLLKVETGDSVPTAPSQLATQLEPELSELGELLSERHQERRKSAETRTQRRLVIQEFDHDVRAIVHTTKGMLRLAGRDDLAERFRPILQRFSRRIKKADADEAAEAAAGAEASTATAEAESASSSETATSQTNA